MQNFEIYATLVQFLDDFLVINFPRAHFVELLRTILVCSCGLKKIKKSHYNSRVSLHEAPTKNGIK